jgi:hypothetical protein
VGQRRPQPRDGHTMLPSMRMGQFSRSRSPANPGAVGCIRGGPEPRRAGASPGTRTGEPPASARAPAGSSPAADDPCTARSLVHWAGAAFSAGR